VTGVDCDAAERIVADAIPRSDLGLPTVKLYTYLTFGEPLRSQVAQRNANAPDWSPGAGAYVLIRFETEKLGPDQNAA
jgi:hypothetical protein